MIHSPFDRCIQTPGICDVMNSRGNSEGQGHIQKFIKGVSGVATHLERSDHQRHVHFESEAGE